MARSLPVKNLYRRICGVNYQLLAVIYISSPMGNSQLLSTTTSYGQWRQRRQIQLTGRTPLPSWAVLPELHVLHGVNAAYKAQDLLHQPRLECASTGMPDQRTNCAATKNSLPLQLVSTDMCKHACRMCVCVCVCVYIYIIQVPIVEGIQSVGPTGTLCTKDSYKIIC